MFTRALSLAERAASMAIDDNLKARYREPLKRLITDLAGEVKKKHV
jgi:phage gp36-like protein